VIVTIWIALALFVAGEYEPRTPRSLQLVARSLFLLGALICAVHIVLAMSDVHGWSHAAAVEATARQTAQVYGLRWGGGVYVNYLFTAVWLADAIARVTSPASVASRSAALVWALRAFYFVIIVNAAVVFARPEVRWMGVVICALIGAAWARGRQRKPHMKDLLKE